MLLFVDLVAMAILKHPNKNKAQQGVGSKLAVWNALVVFLYSIYLYIYRIYRIYISGL